MKVLLHKAVGAAFYSKLVELPFAPTDGMQIRLDGITVRIHQPVWDVSKDLFETAQVPSYSDSRERVHQAVSDGEIINLNRSGWERVL